MTRPLALIAFLALTLSACGKPAAVVLVLGQSNSANYGETQRAAGENVYALDGSVIRPAQDPLPGATGERGSVWTRLGPLLMATRRYSEVIFVSIGVGGSDIASWAEGGENHDRIDRAFADVDRAGLAVTHVLFHQGESDRQERTAPEDYRARFMSVLAAIRAHSSAPVYVAQATRCKSEPYAPIRDAQAALVSLALNVRAGPDTDTITARYDGCHLSSAGLEQAATLWLERL